MAADRRPTGPGESMKISWTLVREIYELGDKNNVNEKFEWELETSLENSCEVIIIEPAKLGDETARWIAVGNCLHKTAVLAGVTCLVAPFMLPASLHKFISLPAGFLSVGSAALYGISWQFDPCCKYQVEHDTKLLSRLPLPELSTSSPVVLVRRDDKYRKRLHNLIAALAFTFCSKQVFDWLSEQ